MTTPAEEAVAKLLQDANILPKLFLGGSASDYRLVIGKGSTILTEHIASGKKVPAVEVGPLLSNASKFLQSNRGGKPAAAAAAAVVTVLTVYGAMQMRKIVKEARSLRAEAAQVQAELNAEPHPQVPPGIESKSVRDEPSPMQTWQPPELAWPEPLPIESNRNEKPFRANSQRSDSPPARVNPAPTSSVDVPTLEGTEGEDDDLAEALLESNSLDSPKPGATGESQVDKEGEIESAAAKVDWVNTVEVQIGAAKSGRPDEGVKRLEQLLLFLDRIPGEQGSLLYPEITVEPLLALIELSLADVSSDVATGGTIPLSVAGWINRLHAYATQIANEELSLRVQEMGSRVDATWSQRDDQSGSLSSGD